MSWFPSGVSWAAPRSSRRPSARWTTSGGSRVSPRVTVRRRRSVMTCWCSRRGRSPRVLPVPGLAEAWIGFTTIGEAIHPRNHVLGKLDTAAAAASYGARRAAVTFVFVGGGYAGMEALAELQDMASGACARYPELSRADMRWIPVQAADRILPEASPAMAGYTTAPLRGRPRAPAAGLPGRAGPHRQRAASGASVPGHGKGRKREQTGGRS